MAFARDWAEVRVAALLFVLNGVALTAVALVFGSELRTGASPTNSFIWGVVALTVAMAAFYWVQERRSRAAPAVGHRGTPEASPRAAQP
jgi:hypothetical protein